MTMARWRLITGIAGVATGVIAAGAGVALAAEKIAVGRQRIPRRASRSASCAGGR
jgi:hypothetical protein